MAQLKQKNKNLKKQHGGCLGDVKTPMNPPFDFLVGIPIVIPSSIIGYFC